MTSHEKAAAVRDLRYHLDRYRSARRFATLAGMRKEPLPVEAQNECSFHAIGVAEALDRLNGSTR